RVVLTRDGELEVAGRRAGIAGVALAAGADLLAVLDPGRDGDDHLALLRPHAGAAAVTARVLDQPAAPAALRAGAGAHHRAEHRADDLAHLAGAVAGRADGRLRAGLRAGLLAAGARRLHLDLHLGAEARRRVVERDRGVRGGVGAGHRPVGATAPAEAEQVVAEQHRGQVAQRAGLGLLRG